MCVASPLWVVINFHGQRFNENNWCKFLDNVHTVVIWQCSHANLKRPGRFQSFRAAWWMSMSLMTLVLATEAVILFRFIMTDTCSDDLERWRRVCKESYEFQSSFNRILSSLVYQFLVLRIFIVRERLPSRTYSRASSFVGSRWFCVPRSSMQPILVLQSPFSVPTSVPSLLSWHSCHRFLPSCEWYSLSC